MLPKGIKAKIISAIKKSPEGIYYKLELRENQTLKRDFYLCLLFVLVACGVLSVFNEEGKRRPFQTNVIEFYRVIKLPLLNSHFLLD